jgi:hypothetical protein
MISLIHVRPVFQTTAKILQVILGLKGVRKAAGPSGTLNRSTRLFSIMAFSRNLFFSALRTVGTECSSDFTLILKLKVG